MIRRRLSLAVAAIFAWLVAGAALAAGDFQVRAYVDPPGPASDTDPVFLVIEVEGSDVGDVSVPSLPALTNLRVVNGPSTSRSTSFEMSGLNVRRSSNLSLRYTLLPLAPGPALIPAVSVHVASEVRQTQPIRLEVVKSRAGPRARGAFPGDRGAEDEGRSSGDVFLEARADASEVWEGQAVLLTVTLFASGADVERFSFMDVPPFPSAWVEDVAADPNAERSSVVRQGRRYFAYPVMRKLLVPTTSGDVTLGPFGAQIQVRRSTGDLFQDLFFQGRGGSLVRRTEPLRLHVKKLPEEGRPADFKGPVGSFRMRVSIDRREAQVNDAVALKATVEGNGSLRSASPPRLELPPDVKVFDPKMTESTSTTGGKLSSTRTWEWVIVPLSPGEVRIPAVRFPYFDPSQGEYREARGDPMALAVRRGDKLPGEGPVARGDVRLQRQEIAFIKPLRGRLAEGHSRIHHRPLFVALILLPVALAPVVIVIGRRQARLQQDKGLARSRRARNSARKKLRAAERKLAGADTGTFHEEVARGLVDYVADRFDRSAAGLTYDLADELLASRGVDAALRRRFRSCLETCDFARFVPGAGQAERKAEVLEEARGLVDELEKAL